VASMADVQTIVNLLSNGQADTNLFALQYSDVVNTLGPTRWHTTTAPVDVTEGTPLISLPSTLLDLIAMIYDGRFLSLLELREVEVLNSGWRNSVGTPISYIEQAEMAQTVELYPAPYTNSPPTATAVYVENRTNVLPILTLPVALLVLQREFARESDHSDYQFAALCGALGQLLLDLLDSMENHI
jgi:hypothetical protein